MKVIKRNGDRVEFNPDKIRDAISLANSNVDPAYKRIPKSAINAIVDDVCNEYIGKNRTKSVEYIADLVEKKLIKSGAYEVAKEYITYRYLHKLARNKYDDLMDVVQSKLSASNVQNQNANVDEQSFGGRVGEVASSVNKSFALDYVMSDKSRQNHINNRIYIHDLDSYAVGSHNCLTMPLDDLLAKGFKTRQTDVRPANSVSTAAQLVAVLFQLQSLQQFGGVSASHIDWTMVPYIRKSFYKHFKDGLKYLYAPTEYTINESFDANDLSIDSEEYRYFAKAYKYATDMTNREVYQAVEGMYHNLK